MRAKSRRSSQVTPKNADVIRKARICPNVFLQNTALRDVYGWNMWKGFWGHISWKMLCRTGEFSKLGKLSEHLMCRRALWLSPGRLKFGISHRIPLARTLSWDSASRGPGFGECYHGWRGAVEGFWARKWHRQLSARSSSPFGTCVQDRAGPWLTGLIRD